ncbi:MAG: hypothetical protein V7L04_18450 [Nostoc sp.]|uniref:hypothetical protein n=1 Tax=Nostoc sp. TaxID=1180 RepID=UPI002FFAAD78
MRSRHYSLVWFASVMIVALTGRASVAFTLTLNSPGATFSYKEESPYTVGQVAEGKTVIDKRLWFDPLPLGGTQRLNQTLFLWSLGASSSGIQGWSFQGAQEALKGSFEIVTYRSCGFGEACGGNGTNIRRDGVGSLFYLKYHPAPSDPQPGQGKLHWIQVVRSNSRQFSIPFVDNAGNGQDPYYDSVFTADENYFLDRPYFPGGLRSNYFDANLYLVQETTPPESTKRTVTIYNGIRWGWRNYVTRRRQPVVCPNPDKINSKGSECSPPPPPCNSGSGGGGCNTYGTLKDESVDQQLPLFDSNNLDFTSLSYDDTSWAFDDQLSDYDIEDANWTEDEYILPFEGYNDSESPASVPESTSTLGLLALLSWGIMKAMKIRLEK